MGAARLDAGFAALPLPGALAAIRENVTLATVDLRYNFQVTLAFPKHIAAEIKKWSENAERRPFGVKALADR